MSPGPIVDKEASKPRVGVIPHCVIEGKGAWRPQGKVRRRIQRKESKRPKEEG